MLAGSASALAAAGLATFTRGAAAAGETPVASATPKPLPAYVAWKDPTSVIVHSSTTIETRRAAFGSGVITPAEQLYIRNNLPAPDASIVADRDAWEVAIEGVKRPRKLTLRELKTMGLETTAMVLQCSGNGRGYFPSKPSGTPWQVGAAGCVMWTGVPVRVVAEALGGVVPGAGFLTGTGGEKLPEGLDPLSIIVERSVPAVAMTDALLAWEMNGVPISLAHGGPLRLIVPGYTGVNNIKYIKRLAFTAKETEARIMSHGLSHLAAWWQGRPQPALGAGDDSQVVDQLARASIHNRRSRCEGRPGASARCGLWRAERRQARGGVAGRRQDLERRALCRAGPGALCLAPVRAGGQVNCWQLHPCQPRHRHRRQRATRAATGERRRLQQHELV